MSNGGEEYFDPNQHVDMQVIPRGLARQVEFDRGFVERELIREDELRKRGETDCADPRALVAWPKPCPHCGMSWTQIGFMEWDLKCKCPLSPQIKQLAYDEGVDRLPHPSLRAHIVSATRRMRARGEGSFDITKSLGISSALLVHWVSEWRAFQDAWYCRPEVNEAPVEATMEMPYSAPWLADVDIKRSVSLSRSNSNLCGEVMLTPAPASWLIDAKPSVRDLYGEVKLDSLAPPPPGKRIAMLEKEVAELKAQLAKPRERLSSGWEHLDDIAKPLPVTPKPMPANALNPSKRNLSWVEF
jgi:hypothetical protein